MKIPFIHKPAGKAAVARGRLAAVLASYPAPVAIRRARQKNLTLSLHPKTGGVRLRVPRWVGQDQIAQFLVEQRSWIISQRAAMPPATHLADGRVIPFRGGTRVIKHVPYRARGVVDNGTELLVGGAAATLGDRLKKWLVLRTRYETAERAKAYTAQTGSHYHALTVRDMHGCWGVCTAETKTRSRLTFNWRLMLCPPAVLDYVVAHEVAHLTYMNHGRPFWQLVESLVDDVRAHENYLADQGPALLRVGVES